jgi:hypothetical protein
MMEAVRSSETSINNRLHGATYQKTAIFSPARIAGSVVAERVFLSHRKMEIAPAL